jgi:hypothetical protein
MSDVAFFGKLDQYARERITVSTTAVGFTTSTLENWQTHTENQVAKDHKASVVLITVVTNGIYYTTDGTTPSASAGNELTTGDQLTLSGFQKLKDFRAIRNSGSDATVEVFYYK